MKSKQPTISINKAGDTGLRWVENVSTGWRLVGFSDEIVASMHHKGWYTNEFYDEVMRGIVYRLPSRKGKPVFAVGYADPNNNDCALVEVITDADDEREAAIQADRIAERCAEKEREYQEAYILGRQYADTLETVTDLKAERKELIAELRVVAAQIQTEVPTLCATIRGRLKDTRKQILGTLRERKAIIEDHWLDRDQKMAFADGAEITLDEAIKLF